VRTGLRKLHNNELHNLYYDQIKIAGLAGHLARMEEKCIKGSGRNIFRKITTWKTLV
jgi:hypothetical protein